MRREDMLTVNDIKDNCMSTVYTRGKKLYNQAAYKNVKIYELADEGTSPVNVIEGCVKGSSGKWYKTHIDFSQEDDSIEDYYCSCPAYENYYGLCKHCVALALYYREWKELEIHKEKVQSKSMRNTSGELKDIIEKYAVKDRGYLFGGYYKQVELIPEITKNYGQYYIEFKIGVDRKYVLKSIPKLLYDIENVRNVTYGKSLQFIHDKSAFTDEAVEWIEIIKNIWKNYYPNADLSYFSYGTSYRSIQLNGYGIEQIILKYKDQKIVINEKKYMVIEENPTVTFHVGKHKDGGAVMSMQMLPYIQGSNHLFAVKDGKIYICSSEFKENAWPIITAFRADKTEYQINARKLYLSREDYGAFCGSVLPKIKDFFKIDKKGVNFEDYMPKEAEFALYLNQDEEERNRILARAEVSYGSQKFNIMTPADLSKDYRDLETEKQFTECLSPYFMSDGDEENPKIFCQGEEAVYKLISEGIGEIQKIAEVFADEKLKKIQFLKPPKVSIGVSVSGELLEMNLKIPDMSKEEVYDILSAYQKKKKYYRLKNGDFLELENSGIAVLSELTDGLGITEEEFESGTMLIPKYRANYIDAVTKQASENVEVTRSKDFRKIIRNMREYQDSDFEIPEGLNAVLRKYQEDGFRWLSTLASWGFGGILADDMGLGKTIQILAFLLSKKKKALIVCPASLVYNWEAEAAKFVPELKVLLIAGNSEERKKKLDECTEADILVTSYDLLKRDIKNYKDRQFDYMVIDEAQYIKNAGTQAAKAVKKIHAGTCFALTGTPVENRLSDLWSIFDFVMPDYLYTYKQFKTQIEQPVVQENDEDARQRLQKMISPFILRRKKQDVLKDLPDKLEKVVYTKLQGEQRKLYEAQVNKLRLELTGKSDEEFKKESIQYLAELTKLRQICCSPELIYENYKGVSSKMETCMELIQNAVDSEHKILLFSQFTQMLDLIKEELQKRNVPFLYLSGKNTKIQRKNMVEEFQQGSIPVFLISLKAGGTGLNLTAADTVIHFDPWWNVAAQNQATDRTHRIGQKNVVNVLKLVARDTIEEKIIHLQEKKAKLAEDIIEGKETAEHYLSREEIIDLLSEKDK